MKNMSRIEISVASIAILFMGISSFAIWNLYQERFGAGYRPVTNYDARLTAFATAAATSFSVNTTKDRSSQEITLANISSSSTVYAYFTVEPGVTGQEELVACSGKSTGVWSSCIRGLAYQGGAISASTTLAHTHNAGSRIIMSDIGQFFGEFVSITGAETIYAVKQFDSFPRTTSTTALPSTAAEFATKLYVDNVGAGGFTASNVSTTLALQVISTGVPSCPSAAACIGLNISTTSSGLYFDNAFGGRLAIFTYATSGLYVDSSGHLAIDTTDALTWTATTTFATSTVMDAFAATGTASGVISAGQTLYVTATGTLALTSAVGTTTTDPYVGIALTGATNGQTVTYVKPGGIYRNFSALTPGGDYYLGNTAGTVVSSTSKGTVPVNIGRAINTTSLQLFAPSFYAVASGSYTQVFGGTGTSTVTTTLGWVPTRIDFVCESAGTNSLSRGEWFWNSDGSSSTRAEGSGTGANYRIFSTNKVCFMQDAAGIYRMWATTSTPSDSNAAVDFFTSANLVPGNPTVTVYWHAERNR